MEIHVYLAVYFKYCESLSEKLKREQSEWIAKAIEKVTGIYDPDMSSMEPANPAKKLLDCVENGLRGEDSIAKRTMDDFCTILRSCNSCYDLITTRMRQDCRGRPVTSSKKNGTSIIICAMEWACHLLTMASLPEPELYRPRRASSWSNPSPAVRVTAGLG